MANSLNRTLNTGDKVVMRGGASVVIGTQLFGCIAETSGTKIAVRRIGSDAELTASGSDIDAEETMKRHGSENGWTAVASAQ